MSLTASKLNSFIEELLVIRRSAYASLSTKDYHHLNKIIWTNRILLLIGFSTSWIMPNPFSMLTIGIALSGMWTIVAHHVLHAGYDKVPGVPKRYHSETFASGWRRYFDWYDWIYPPAWKYEHNVLHHFHTNEKLDPDQMAYRLAANTSVLSNNLPKWLKLIQIIIKISSWKFSYYSFNTIKGYVEKKNYQQNSDFSKYRWQTLKLCILPYTLFHFILLPIMFLPLGWHAAMFFLINRVGAEIITNWHTFFIIVPNHTGDDLVLHNHHFNSKEQFYLNQISSSCNFNTGGFWRDYLHGYLNYQIEHHLFPNLPASQYVKLQPQIKSLCAKYNIPYIQEPIFKRVRKLFEIMLQKELMTSSIVVTSEVNIA